MKKKELMTLLTTLVFVFTIPSAFAKQMSDQELSMAFGSQIKPQQVAVLSQQEMDATEGGIGPVCIWLADTAIARVGLSVGRTAWNAVSNFFRSSPAATGAVAGNIGYVTSQYGSGQPITTPGLVGATVGGAIGGPIGGRFGPLTGAGIGGFSGGVTQRYVRQHNGSNNFGRDVGSYCAMCRANGGYGFRF